MSHDHDGYAHARHAPRRMRPPPIEVRDEARWPTRVLLAEDDVEMCALLVEVLSSRGYDVQVARDGDRLWASLSAVRSGGRPAPDVIVSDVRMPGPSGLEVLELLRQDDWATPVILITAFGTERTHEEARRLGAVTVLDKPFDMDELVECVVAILPPAF